MRCTLRRCSGPLATHETPGPLRLSSYDVDALEVALRIGEHADEAELVVATCHGRHAWRPLADICTAAALLSIAFASAVVAYEVDLDSRCVRIERELEASLREQVHLLFPALLTIQSGIQVPRYPNLSNTLRASRSVIERHLLAPPAHERLCPDFFHERRRINCSKSCTAKHTPIKCSVVQS